MGISGEIEGIYSQRRLMGERSEPKEYKGSEDYGKEGRKIEEK